MCGRYVGIGALCPCPCPCYRPRPHPCPHRCPCYHPRSHCLLPCPYPCARPCICRCCCGRFRTACRQVGPHTWVYNATPSPALTPVTMSLPPPLPLPLQVLLWSLQDSMETVLAGHMGMTGGACPLPLPPPMPSFLHPCPCPHPCPCICRCCCGRCRTAWRRSWQVQGARASRRSWPVSVCIMASRAEAA